MKIIIIAGYANSLISFRGELIKRLIKEGCQVVALAPETGFEKQLHSIGCRYYSFAMQRNKMNVFQDIYSLFLLWKILKKEKPDIVLSYTIKPVIYGSLAAQMAKVPHIYSMITGLGYIFAGKTTKKRVMRFFIKFLYKLALRKNKKIFFQNPDDLALFHSQHLLPGKKSAVLINGSGVDTDKFSWTEPRIHPVTFLLIARLIWDKGIGEFVEAASLLKPRYPGVHFKILGPYDTNPAAISRQKMESWVAGGAVEYLGETGDVRPYIAQSSVFVLPSYHEGTPRSVLEAMSMGRPIITTDAPGCRETVKQGVNGFLVPVKDSQALTRVMEHFILHPRLISGMGAKSRELAVEKYDVHKVNHAIIEAMRLRNLRRGRAQ